MLNPQLDAFFKFYNEQFLMLTYPDVRLKTNESDVLPRQGNLNSWFSRRIPLRMPIVSSAMDTVTEARMAIAMAELGGLGVIHKNMSPQNQAAQVRRVKHYLNARVNKPITVDPFATLEQIKALCERERYNFESFPVVENGVIVGILTGKDFTFAENLQVTAGVAMSPILGALVGSPETTSEEAMRAMRGAKKNVMPLVNKEGQVVGMYVFSDIQRVISGQSLHNVDSKGQLIAAAAVGAGDEALIRAQHLVEAHCDVLVIDTAHADHKNVKDTVRKLKLAYPDIDVVAGNVSRFESVLRLIDAGADGILVGQGPGSICTTRIVAGVGCPQISAVYECAKAGDEAGVPICADGGIQDPGDIAIALAIGASSVMVGNILAGTDKSPGDVVQEGDRQMKVYRGMGSLEAMTAREESKARYGQSGIASNKLVPEGKQGKVPYTGPLADVINYYIGGVHSSMGYLGAPTLEKFRDNAEIFRITDAGLRESHTHHLMQ